MSGCRISKVRFKSGGEVYRLPEPSRDEAQRYLVSRAAMIAGFYKPDEIRGYAIMAWDKDGFSSVGYFLHDEGVIGRTLMPSFVADALRRKMIEEGDWEAY